MATKQNPADKIVADIIAQIENGEARPEDWTAPWHRGTAAGLPENALTGRAYSGINTLILGMAGLRFETNRWCTFRAWKEAGHPVMKGEKGTQICFYSTLEKETGNIVNGEAERATIPFIKVYTVFNASQVEGGADLPALEGEALVDEVEPSERADAFITASGAVINHGGARAFYRPSTDEITMPDRARFFGVGEASAGEAYYSTLLHELTHWTGAAHRLDRVKGDRFGDPKYAFEELVAELGAVFLCRKLNIESSPRADHAQYLAGWLKCLKEHPRALFRAAAQAQRAVAHLEALEAGEAQPVAKPAPKPAPVPVPEPAHWPARLVATEATRAGAQYVLAGAEKRQAPAKAQLELLF